MAQVAGGNVAALRGADWNNYKGKGKKGKGKKGQGKGKCWGKYGKSSGKATGKSLNYWGTEDYHDAWGWDDYSDN